MVVDGAVRAVTYGRPCAIRIDPIEKKPLFHFLPGSRILSLAAAGCNLHCKHCQNWSISQAAPQDVRSAHFPPEKVVEAAKRRECPSIAYTYTEPVVYYEYVVDTAKAGRAKGLKNVTVTAGYINTEPMKLLASLIDASNTDLKAFSDAFYRDVCKGTLKPVLDAMVIMKERGVWVEVTNLVIPTFNDDLGMIREMCRWIATHLGPETPLHLSRFHPMYQLRNLPPTPVEFLLDARKEALECGLQHVYVGNVMGSDAEHTYCPNDGTLLIERYGYAIHRNALVDGACPTCGRSVAGVWSDDA